MIALYLIAVVLLSAAVYFVYSSFYKVPKGDLLSILQGEVSSTQAEFDNLGKFALDGTPQTFSVWVNISKPATVSEVTGMILGNYPLGNFGLGIWGGGQPRFFNNWKPDLYPSPKIYLEADKWVHLVWIKDVPNKTITLYINGDKVFSWTGVIDDTNVNYKEIRVGNDNNKGRAYFKGKISNINIFSKILSPEEISRLYTKTKPT